MLDLGSKVIQEMIIKYVIELRDKQGLKHSTINGRCTAILHFLDMNDVGVNRHKIKRHLPYDESTRDDRPYTNEEIQRIISVCDLRSKAMVLLMISSGVRIGALSSMKIGDLVPVSYQGMDCYKIIVYARTHDKYYSFCTPECRAKAIDPYLDFRKRCGEELGDKSPLFRKGFNKDNPFIINSPRFLSNVSPMQIIDHVLNESGVRTSEAMRSHAFRKGFKSFCEQSGMKSINVEWLLGHDIGVSGHYYRPVESDILQDYMTHAADALTISDEHRLKKQVQELETEKDQHIARLKEQLDASDSQRSTDLKELYLKLDEYLARIMEVEAKLDMFKGIEFKEFRERRINEAADLRTDIAKRKQIDKSHSS